MFDPFNDKQFEVGVKFRSEGKQNCPECNEEFELNIFNDGYPNRENELVCCPYCKKTVGHIRTSGTVNTFKV